MDKKPSVTRRESWKVSILTSTGMLIPGIAQAASQEGEHVTSRSSNSENRSHAPENELVRIEVASDNGK